MQLKTPKILFCGISNIYCFNSYYHIIGTCKHHYLDEGYLGIFWLAQKNKKTTPMQVKSPWSLLTLSDWASGATQGIGENLPENGNDAVKGNLPLTTQYLLVVPKPSWSPCAQWLHFPFACTHVTGGNARRRGVRVSGEVRIAQCLVPTSCAFLNLGKCHCVCQRLCQCVCHRVCNCVCWFDADTRLQKCFLQEERERSE